MFFCGKSNVSRETFKSKRRQTNKKDNIAKITLNNLCAKKYSIQKNLLKFQNCVEKENVSRETLIENEVKKI